MKSLFSHRLFNATLLLAGTMMFGCNSERVATGAAPPSEQEIVWFRAANPTKQPTLFGRIEVLDKPGPYALASAILSLDNNLSTADDAGNYRLVLEPGTHQFMAGQIGIHRSILRLKVGPGDSVRINFHLRPDLRPLE